MNLTPTQLNAVKELLHLSLDKEVPAITAELLGELPGLEAVIAKTVFNAAYPIILKTIDAAIDSL